MLFSTTGYGYVGSQFVGCVELPGADDVTGNGGMHSSGSIVNIGKAPCQMVVGGGVGYEGGCFVVCVLLYVLPQ